MSKLLIVGEHFAGKLKANAGELVGAARQLSGEVHGAALGPGSAEAAHALGAYGLASVAAIGTQCSTDSLTAALADFVQQQGFDYVVFQHSFFGRDFGARLAARLKGAWLNDVTAITAGTDGSFIFSKPLYAGKVIGSFKLQTSGVKVLTLRPKNFPAVQPEVGSSVAVTELPSPAAPKARITGLEAKAAGMVDLKDADIIVSGGRGLGGPEGFEPLRDFAQAIGAALGASRATVDAGWIPHSHQVGQTGKVVNPKLYIACGISGAIQHLAGMQTSRCIVAINSNENAPIFRIADYGIVGDVFEIIPELQKQLVEALKH
jgi:electron transfer flavoprotein alpha subunit